MASQRILTLLMVMAALCAVTLEAAGPQTGSRSATAPAQAWQQALVNRYCVTCHNSRLRTAGLALDVRDATMVGDAPEIWEHVVRKLRAGAMPPSLSPRPDPTTYDRFTMWLESELDRAAAANLNPGRTEAFHRLNRTEYHNAIRDLLDLEVDVAELLPADASSYGFDNLAGALGFSPALLERYLDAARKISRLAVGRPATSPTEETFRVANDLPQDDRVDGLPFGTRGGASFRYTFPGDGDYALRVRLARDASGTLAAFTVPHMLVVSLDSAPVQNFTVGEPPPSGAPRTSEAYRTWLNRQRNIDQSWEFRVPMKAGPHEIQITFLKKTDAYPETVRQPYQRPYTSTTGGDTRYEPYLGSVTVTGPYGASAPPAGETPSRRRIFVCRPVGEAAGEQAACARNILSRLARRAYRRPLMPADLDVPLGYFEKGRQQEGFEAGIEMALRWLLASPQFVLRVERDPAAVAAATNYPITDLELASRLSFFLWSSIPDDELLDVAIAGRLRDPEVLERQTRRMLADDRSRALVTSFASQWLYLRNVPAVVPDADLFPDFGEDLRAAMQRETELFVESVIREDRSALDLLNADYTFVNERLARHYGIPNVFGSQFRRVQLPDEARRGLLGQASILAVTAYPNRTSPVLRGKWVLQNLLGSPPPSPPPNVPALEATTSKSARPLSMREAMELHRANPACASCHRVMDPPGFALEQFDAVGRLRMRTETGAPINASGQLPDGTTFEGAAGLRAALERKPDRFVGTLTEKLMIYALGRGLEYYDAPTVRAITRDAAKDDYRFSSLVLGIVKSPPFRMRRTQP